MSRSCPPWQGELQGSLFGADIPAPFFPTPYLPQPLLVKEGSPSSQISGHALRVTPRVEIEVPIFEGGYGVKFFEETVRQFEALRPDIKVNLYGDPRIMDKIRIRLMEGTTPDATDAPGLPWPNLIRNGKILDLAPYMNGPNWENDARWRDTFLPGSIEFWSEDEHIWAVPLAYGIHAVFYNKKLFHEHGWNIPRTYTQLFDLCERMKQEGVEPFAFPGVYMGYLDAFLEAAHYNLVGPGEFKRQKLLEKGAYSDPRHKRAAGSDPDTCHPLFSKRMGGNDTHRRSTPVPAGQDGDDHHRFLVCE